MSGVGPYGEEPSEYDREERAPSRPFVQVVLAAGLVALVGLVSATAPERPRQVLAWVSKDIDLAGRWAEVRAWASGWGGALGEEVEGLKRRFGGLREEVAEAPAPEAPEAPEVPSAPEAILPVMGELLYDYGWLPQGQEPHGGLDFSAAIGEPVLAIADGTVLRVAADPALGGLVEVDHGFIIALYGQVGGSRVRAGEQVTQGQTLATVAAPTGKEGDRQAHLHLEVRVTPGAKPVDPAPFLPMSAAPRGGDGN